MTVPKFDDYRDYMRYLLDKRVEVIKSRVESVKKNYIDKLGPNDPIARSGEEDRQWLVQFAKGKGLDIACGDFTIGDAEGVDGAEKQIGCVHFSEGDELAFAEPGKYDFVVTNYLDAFSNPLKALNDWYRALKFGGGVLAIVCRDAEAPTTNKRPELGPLSNAKRQALYTKITLSQYMYRAGFTGVVVARTKHGSLRANAIKAANPGNNCPKCGQDRSHLP